MVRPLSAVIDEAQEICLSGGQGVRVLDLLEPTEGGSGLYVTLEIPLGTEAGDLGIRELEKRLREIPEIAGVVIQLAAN